MSTHTSTLAVYEVRGSYVDGYGWGMAEVLATSASAAIEQAIAQQWLIGEATEVTVKRTRLAYCEHPDAHGLSEHTIDWSGDFTHTVWECDDCPETWTGDEHPEPTLKPYAFTVYCESLVERGAA